LRAAGPARSVVSSSNPGERIATSWGDTENIVRGGRHRILFFSLDVNTRYPHANQGKEPETRKIREVHRWGAVGGEIRSDRGRPASESTFFHRKVEVKLLGRRGGGGGARLAIPPTLLP
jgi:hypothetical protein